MSARDCLCLGRSVRVTLPAGGDESCRDPGVLCLFADFLAEARVPSECSQTSLQQIPSIELLCLKAPEQTGTCTSLSSDKSLSFGDGVSPPWP